MQIKEVIDKFYAGETTKQDELLLMEFFAGGNVPEEFRSEQEFFATYFNLNKVYPEATTQIEAKIEEWDVVERNSQRHILRIRKWKYGVAATALLLIGVGIGLGINLTKEAEAQPHLSEFRDTYTNPQDAYEEAHRALTLFSNKINEGLSLASGKKTDSNTD